MVWIIQQDVKRHKGMVGQRQRVALSFLWLLMYQSSATRSCCEYIQQYAQILDILLVHYYCFSAAGPSVSNFVFQVLLKNATSVPLEVRFDIPFGVSPKVLRLEGKYYFFSIISPTEFVPLSFAIISFSRF